MVALGPEDEYHDQGSSPGHRTPRGQGPDLTFPSSPQEPGWVS